MINIDCVNLFIVIISLFLLLSIIQIILLIIYKRIYRDTRDEYIINLSVLERVIDDHYNMILKTNIDQVRKNYNLDPESKVNSIIAFEKQVNELVSKASIDIMKMLSPKTLKCLRKRFTDNSLALLITNQVKNKCFRG